MSGAIPPLPHYAFVAWSSAKAQGQLYLLPFAQWLLYVGYILLSVWLNTVIPDKNHVPFLIHP